MRRVSTMNEPRPQHAVRSFFLFAALLLVPGMGCAGGGTSGTGISSVARLSGSAYTSSGRPMVGMTITVTTPDEERTLITESDGTYDTFIEYEIGSEIAYSFDSEENGVASRWTFDEVPEGTASIVNRWDQDGSQMRPTTTDFFDKDGDRVGSEED